MDADGKPTTDDSNLRNKPITKEETAVSAGIAYKDGDRSYTKKGYSRDGGNYYKRRREPGFIDALSIPSGLAVNAGIGL